MQAQQAVDVLHTARLAGEIVSDCFAEFPASATVSDHAQESQQIAMSAEQVDAASAARGEAADDVENDDNTQGTMGGREPPQ